MCGGPGNVGFRDERTFFSFTFSALEYVMYYIFVLTT